jgi:hypothetical protein
MNDLLQTVNALSEPIIFAVDFNAVVSNKNFD